MPGYCGVLGMLGSYWDGCMMRQVLSRSVLSDDSSRLSLKGSFRSALAFEFVDLALLIVQALKNDGETIRHLFQDIRLHPFECFEQGCSKCHDTFKIMAHLLLIFADLGLLFADLGLLFADLGLLFADLGLLFANFGLD